ncbi:MAG: lipoyl(octanoyl) transferase LipB [bacterium]
MRQGILLKTGISDYQTAWDLQKFLHRARLVGEIEDTLILTEHPHTYTIGKAGSEENLIAEESVLNKNGIAVYRIDRGGDITYHGPGQIVAYSILDLRNYYLDVHRFRRDLEEVIIQTLSEYGIQGERITGLTGVWVEGAKVAAIGVKVSRWITMHGFAFNVNSDLSYFEKIVPCGITDKPVTSMAKLLGVPLNYQEIQELISHKFEVIFQINLTERKPDHYIAENLNWQDFTSIKEKSY